MNPWIFASAENVSSGSTLSWTLLIPLGAFALVLVGAALAYRVAPAGQSEDASSADGEPIESDEDSAD